MNIVRFKDASHVEPENGWLRKKLCNENAVSVEHFMKPPRHSSPVHSHPEAQVLVALKGRLTVINNENVSFNLDEGDTAFFAAYEPHRVINRLDTTSTGLDIFIPGRSFDYWLKRKE